MGLLFSQVKIQADLDADNVVKIYDTISLPERDQMFIVMEYCEGGNLLQWIKRHRRHQLINQLVWVYCQVLCMLTVCI